MAEPAARSLRGILTEGHELVCSYMPGGLSRWKNVGAGAAGQIISAEARTTRSSPHSFPFSISHTLTTNHPSQWLTLVNRNLFPLPLRLRRRYGSTSRPRISRSWRKLRKTRQRGSQRNGRQLNYELLSYHQNFATSFLLKFLLRVTAFSESYRVYACHTS